MPQKSLRSPAAVALFERRISQREIAQLYNCSEQFVWQVLNGRIPPPERFRALLSRLTDLEEHELFPDALASSGRAS